MSMDKQGEALELVNKLAGADAATVIAQMDAVADLLDGDGDALAELNGALNLLRNRVKQMQVALAPHMSAIAAMEAARRKAANMTSDEKLAMAQLLVAGKIEGKSEVRASKV